jgi:hypothetical protein
MISSRSVLSGNRKYSLSSAVTCRYGELKKRVICDLAIVVLINKKTPQLLEAFAFGIVLNCSTLDCLAVGLAGCQVSCGFQLADLECLPAFADVLRGLRRRVGIEIE